MKVICTGFEPFGGKQINFSKMLVHDLYSNLNNDCALEISILPVDFKNAFTPLHKLALLHKPNWIFCFGQASKRSSISLERLAINLMDSSQPDNSGYSPEEEPIKPHAPLALKTNFPIKEMLDELKNTNTPAEISNSAGTYVCNTLFYKALLELQNENTKIGFIHIPDFSENIALMNYEHCLDAIQSLIKNRLNKVSQQ